MVRIAPPPALLAPCPRPAWSGRTWRDLADYTLRLRGALERCATQIDAIRLWADTPSRDHQTRSRGGGRDLADALPRR